MRIKVGTEAKNEPVTREGNQLKDIVSRELPYFLAIQAIVFMGFGVGIIYGKFVF